MCVNYVYQQEDGQTVEYLHKKYYSRTKNELSYNTWNKTKYTFFMIVFI